VCAYKVIAAVAYYRINNLHYYSSQQGVDLSDGVQFAGEEYNAVRVRLLSRKFQA